VKRLFAIVLCVAVPAAVFGAESSYWVVYDGGSIGNIQSGTSIVLALDSNQIRFVKKHDGGYTMIPTSAVTEVSYGQDVHRRVGTAIGLAFVSFGIGALMALTKSKKHFIGLTWDSDGEKGGAAFQVDKSYYRGLLAGLEGVTGKRAVNSDAMTVKN
jgi:hypothetical protein